jgi:hypothetical protein
MSVTRAAAASSAASRRSADRSAEGYATTTSVLTGSSPPLNHSASGSE